MHLTVSEQRQPSLHREAERANHSVLSLHMKTPRHFPGSTKQWSNLLLCIYYKVIISKHYECRTQTEVEGGGVLILVNAKQ